MEKKTKFPGRRWGILFLASSVLFSVSASDFTRPTSGGEEESILSVQQQSKTVRGTVTDAEGFELTGVNVVEKGTTNGTTTDVDGKFSLTVTGSNPVLQFSYVGFKSLEVAVGNQPTVNVRMQEDSQLMDEVVVIGYGTQKRADVTSSVATVKAESFNTGSIVDAGQLIQGKVAGLQISTASGDPTQSTSVMLRGNSSITGTQDPLILINGVPGDFSTVSPQDIESIDVLKDGSATAIYGTRGTNGVIIITTKTPRREAPTSIEYNGYVTAQTFVKKADFMDASDLRQRWDEGYSFIGANDRDFGYDTDWLDEISRTGFVHNHDLTFRGGGKNTSIIANLTYAKNQGTMKTMETETTRGRFEFVHRMFDDKLISTASVIADERLRSRDFNTDIYRYALIQNPTQPVYNPNYGTGEAVWDETPNSIYLERPIYFYDNPVSIVNEQKGEVRTRGLRFNGSLDFRPIESLSLKMTYSRTNNNQITGSYTTRLAASSTEGSTNGAASRSTNNSVSNQLELIGTWNQTFGKHTIGAVAGYSYYDYTYEYFSANNSRYPTDAYLWNNLDAGLGVKEGIITSPMSSSKSSNKLIGLFARATYNYDNRYLLMVSLRHEGSSRFGKDSKWGNFPSISAGWRLDQEGFMKEYSWINLLKLRLGFGVTGTDAGSNYQALASVGYSEYFLYQGKWINQLGPVRNANPNLRWEKKNEYNLGVDFDLFKGRLGGAIDLYKRDTKDLLYNYSVPSPPYQTGSLRANVGEMTNSGFEIMINAVPVQTKEFRWRTNMSYSTNKNKLVSIDNEEFKMTVDYFDTGHTGEPVQQYTHRVQVGNPIGNFYGWKSVGVDKDGKWVVERLKKDENGNITERYYGLAEEANNDDKQILGNGIPKHYLNWNNTIYWKNLDLSINMRGAFGQKILNYQEMFYANAGTLYNSLNSAFDLHPVVDVATGQPTGESHILTSAQSYVSHYVEDGSYWKIDNVTLGYSFNLKSKYINRLRVYAATQNLLTITSYSGLDPEVRISSRRSGGSTIMDAGSDQRDKYPTLRSFTFGVNVTF
ncbi:TonB-linked SusC/RagA family outer membrane protein [Parabacteroides sp. PFB2-10]|uniref:SusC/RagA family TonB-linked outer membrane protein n=1 Tax=Parabacteroides sp. PFB2-10 TaxID=1742405 RepID=UPI0024758874|nr:TonB-dependent receptor [Parabacteroides sp. PFB2-10]MDH6312104.1 TonB-linked SusC/RagA family outer membrane protein [Parabacteroides sp. PFB2-10]MDL2245306.1 TonB-dependent receptor [Parabacteroides sp. OttesenSCG-928-J18]